VIVTAPVTVLSARPAGQVPTCEIVASPAPPRVAGAPLTVSFAATLAIGVLAVPATAVPLSGTGRIDAVTVTVSVAVAQSGGVFLSHSWYTRL
jgi:hypothetical protein